MVRKTSSTLHEIRPLALKTFNDQPVTAIYSLYSKHSSALREVLSAADIAVFEADIKISDRYLMERFIYGSVKICADLHWTGNYWQCHSAQALTWAYIGNA